MSNHPHHLSLDTQVPLPDDNGLHPLMDGAEVPRVV